MSTPPGSPVTKADLDASDWQTKLHAWLSTAAAIVGVIGGMIIYLQSNLGPKPVQPVQVVAPADSPEVKALKDRIDALEKGKKP